MSQKNTFEPVDMMHFRHQLGTFINKVDLTEQRFVIQRRGKPKALLVPIEDQEAIESTGKTNNDELDRMYHALKGMEGMIDDDMTDTSQKVDEINYGQAYDEAQQEVHD